MVDRKIDGPSSDARAVMMFQSRSRSVGVAYLLLLLLGGLGVHRFYLGSREIGILMLVCTILGLALRFPLVITAIIFIYDLFTIPSRVRQYNDELMAEIGVQE